jgi:hypothetical protein
MGQAITHARKGSTIIFVTVFGKMFNVDCGFPFLLIHFKRVDFYCIDLRLFNYIYNLLKNKFLIIKFVRN